MSSIQFSKKIISDCPAIEYEEYTLGNGLKVVLCNTGIIPVAVVNTTFHVGSKDEDEDKTGMAHLFEHLMFEGSPSVPRGKFDEILNKNGGDSNAYTTRDSTSYYITIPSNHLETALWLDSDRLSGFGITEESLEIQKDVILEEKLLYVDNSPYGTVEEESSKRLFGNNGYGWSVIGNMDDLRKVTLNDLKYFYSKYYSPDNAVITVTGDIDYDRTIKLIDKYYGSIKRGKPFKRKIYSDKAISNEITADINDNIQLEGKFTFYKLPSRGTKDYYAMNILNGILSSGDSSRLYQELEYKNELVNEIDSSLMGMENASILIITAIALKGQSLKVIGDKTDEIIEEIKNGNITDREFDKIINGIETRFNSRMQSIVSLADRFSYLKTFFNDCSRINYEILDYLALTKNDVIETANKYLNKDQRLVLNYLPGK